MCLTIVRGVENDRKHDRCMPPSGKWASPQIGPGIISRHLGDTRQLCWNAETVACYPTPLTGMVGNTFFAAIEFLNLLCCACCFLSLYLTFHISNMFTAKSTTRQRWPICFLDECRRMVAQHVTEWYVQLGVVVVVIFYTAWSKH